MTLYVFDAHMRVRRVLVSGIAELVHHEDTCTLTAEVGAGAQVRPGEYLGMMCVDGRYRIFAVDDADDSDAHGTTQITATDAAVAELQDGIVEDVRAEDITVADAVGRVIAGTAWQIGKSEGGDKREDVSAYYVTRWAALEEIAKGHEVRILPYYAFADGQITGRIIDIEARTKVFRGRIFTAQADAQDITITRQGRPMTRAYGVGKATGTNDPPTRVTIADAVWSRAAGDPADKPKGQTWVEDAQAAAQYGTHAMVHTQEDAEDAQTLLAKTWEALQRRIRPEVGGEAVVQDLEMVDGQDYKRVRMYDLVAIVTRDGQAVDAQVIGIDRDYVRPHRTSIKLGDESEDKGRRSVSARIAGIVQSEYRGRGTAAAQGNRIIHNDALIQLNAEAIQLNAKEILAQAEQIKLMATHEEVVQLGEETATLFNEVGVVLNAHTAELLLTAKQTEVTALGERVSSAEIAIDGANAQIALKVNRDGVISAINVSSEGILIQSRRINLAGYVTASQLSVELANFKLSMHDNLTTNNLSVNSRAYLPSYVTMASHVISLESKEVVTGVNTSRMQVCRSVQVDANGDYSGWTATYVNSVSGVDTETIYYLRWS